jgi:hypothetical protein
MHPTEWWWWWEANKPVPVYTGKRFSMTGDEVEGIVADLKSQGLKSKWHNR